LAESLEFLKFPDSGKELYSVRYYLARYHNAAYLLAA
jgi:hypothetical protein